MLQNAFAISFLIFVLKNKAPRYAVSGNLRLICEKAKQFHEEFMKMLADTTEEERSISMNAIFRIASEAGVRSLTEVWKGRRQHIPEMLNAIRKLPKEQRNIVFPFVARMLRMTTTYYGGKR